MSRDGGELGAAFFQCCNIPEAGEDRPSGGFMVLFFLVRSFFLPWSSPRIAGRLKDGMSYRRGAGDAAICRGSGAGTGFNLLGLTGLLVKNEWLGREMWVWG